jgi:hypothetical protein
VSDFRKKLARYFEPDRKVMQVAHRLSDYAHQDWVIFFFLILYFLDSFLVFLPAEALLSLTLLLAPEKTRPWSIAAIAGAVFGFAIFYFLSLSSFEPYVIKLIHENDWSHQFDRIVNAANHTGYLNLALAVWTVVPPIACLVGGILVGLNPFLVFMIVLSAKVFRIFFMIYLMRVLKNSISGLRKRLQHSED